MTNYQQVFDTLFKNSEGDEKELKEIINIETDVFDLKDRFGNPIGKKMITIEGVTKIARYFKAQFGKPEIIDTPSKENAQGYVVLVEVSFPNGESHYEVGEANNINLKGGANGYKFTMAVKRAKSRALLKSATVALDYFLTEDEITDNDDLQTQKQNEESHLQPPEEIQSDVVNLKPELTVHIGDFSLNSLTLPVHDKKYPGMSIIDILQKFDDRDYLKQLKSIYPHNKDLRNAIIALSQRVGFDEKNQTNTLGEFIEKINKKMNENEVKNLELIEVNTVTTVTPDTTEECIDEVFNKENTDISPSTQIQQLTNEEIDEVLGKEEIEAPEIKKIYVNVSEDEIFSDTEAFLASLESVVPTLNKNTQKEVKIISEDEEGLSKIIKDESISETKKIENKEEPPKPKRGRPKKDKSVESMVEEKPKKKPGRPKKIN